MSTFSRDDAESIAVEMDLLDDFGMRSNLAFLLMHYQRLPALLTDLETRNSLLSDQFAKFDEIKTLLRSVPGAGKSIYQKYCEIQEKNEGLEMLRTISNIHQGSNH